MAKKNTTIFNRLLRYFLLVMAIPLFILIITYFYQSEMSTKKIIQNQTDIAIENDARNISQIFDEYRKIAFYLATDSDIMAMMEADAVAPELSRSVYTTLFSTIGSGSSAEAHIVSASGKVRLSTSTFPEIYDVRIYNNDWDNKNILARALSNKGSKTPSETIISINERRTTDAGKLIFATVLRRVVSDKGEILGYVIIDIFTDVLAGNVDTSSIFNEEILLDNSVFTALSLIHPSIYGDAKTFDVEGDDYVYATKDIAGTNLSLMAVTDTSPYETNLSEFMTYLLFALFAGVAVSIILSLIFSNSITKQVKPLTESMEAIEEGNFSQRISVDTGIKEFNQLALSYNTMIEELEKLLEITREEEAKLAEAERKELEMQLNPHFLFNTLNTIKALARLNNQEEIYTITIKLGKILRSTLKNRGSESTIRESLELVESYLTIQKIRFKDKISYEIDADEALLDQHTPKLIIQPLVENSIKHGLEPMTKPGKVSIRIKELGDYMVITVQDNGIGFDSSTLEKDIESLAGSEHVGLYNVYRRLQLRYSKLSYFSIESNQGRGTTIEIRIPKSIEE